MYEQRVPGLLREMAVKTDDQSHMAGTSASSDPGETLVREEWR